MQKKGENSCRFVEDAKKSPSGKRPNPSYQKSSRLSEVGAPNTQNFGIFVGKKQIVRYRLSSYRAREGENMPKFCRTSRKNQASLYRKEVVFVQVVGISVESEGRESSRP